MECPRCKLVNPDSAQRCDCGYDFPTGTMRGSYAEAARRSKGLAPEPSEAVRALGCRDIQVGGVIFVLGLTGTVVSYAYAQTHGGTYVLAYGAVVWGLIQFLRGVDRSRSGLDRAFWRTRW